MRTRVQVHVSYKLLYHVVWIPKYRFKVLKKGVAEYTKKAIKTSIQDRYPDVIIDEISIQPDHLHILIVIPPKYSISKVIGDIKRDSSRKLRQKFEHLKRGRESLWSIGYFISSVGLNEQQIKRYVEYQEKQDTGQLEAVWEDEATGRVR